MWDLPGPGTEPLSPELAGGFFYHWATREALLAGFLMIAILTDVRWYCIMVFICIFLMVNDVEHGGSWQGLRQLQGIWNWWNLQGTVHWSLQCQNLLGSLQIESWSLPLLGCSSIHFLDTPKAEAAAPLPYSSCPDEGNSFYLGSFSLVLRSSSLTDGKVQATWNFLPSLFVPFFLDLLFYCVAADC